MQCIIKKNHMQANCVVEELCGLYLIVRNCVLYISKNTALMNE